MENLPSLFAALKKKAVGGALIRPEFVEGDVGDPGNAGMPARVAEQVKSSPESLKVTMPTVAKTAAMTSLIGQFKTFGNVGPVYEVLAGVKVEVTNGKGGESLMRVRVLESGEELQLPASQIAQDPLAV